MGDQAPDTLPLTCGYCGQPVTLTYVPDAARSALWTCPAIGCACQNIVTRAQAVLAVSKRENKSA